MQKFTLTQSYFILLLFSLPEKTYPKNTAKTSVKECTVCVSFWQFYGFSSYIVIFSTLEFIFVNSEKVVQFGSFACMSSFPSSTPLKRLPFSSLYILAYFVLD